MLKRLRLSAEKLISLGIVCLLATLFLGRVVAADALTDPIQVTDKTEDSTCMECHAIRGFAVPTGDTGDTRKRSLHIDVASLQDSVHSEEQCTSCHIDIKQMPHKKDKERTIDCVTCHEELSKKQPQVIPKANVNRVNVPV